MKEITVEQLMQWHERGETMEVIDVRTPAEYREVHIPFAKNVPLESFHPDEFVQQRCDSSIPVVIVCRTGRRATRACQQLKSCGLENGYVLVGGTEAWEAEGHDVVRGKKAMSLEQQVRIAAGTMVFAGTLLGAFVHPALLVIPAFVGAGLVYAGVTDSCPMAMLIAKLPWNQVTLECAGSCSEASEESKTGAGKPHFAQRASQREEEVVHG